MLEETSFVLYGMTIACFLVQRLTATGKDKSNDEKICGLLSLLTDVVIVLFIWVVPLIIKIGCK